MSDDGNRKQRAEDYLLGEVIQPSSNSHAKIESGEGALAAYRAFGLLTADEATAWEARIRRSAVVRERQPLSPDPELHERARRLVHSRLDQLESDERVDDHDDLYAVQQLLESLARIGLLSARDASDYADRLHPRLEALIPYDYGGELPNCTAARLLRFVPGPFERHAGVRMIGFDLYDDGVALRYEVIRLAPAEDGSIRRMPDELESDAVALKPWDPFFSLQDDLGTAYQFLGGGGGGSGSAFVDRVTVSVTYFGGSVPSEARRLWATASGYRWVVSL